MADIHRQWNGLLNQKAGKPVTRLQGWQQKNINSGNKLCTNYAKQQQDKMTGGGIHESSIVFANEFNKNS